MEMVERLRALIKDRKWAVFMTVCGIAGMLLIMLSSLLTADKERTETIKEEKISITDTSDYCRVTEKRLEEFLSSIDGAGDVRVYLTVGSSERYIYASEGRLSRGESKTEEEKKYVIVSGSGERSALVETVEAPEITGVVIASSGSGSAYVREQLYRSTAAALGISTSKIFVTKLR